MKKVFSKSLSFLLSVVMIFGIVAVSNLTVFAAQFIFPFSQSYNVTQNFGNNGHLGTDFGCPLKTPIYASCAGTVKVVDYGCLGSHISSNYACSKGSSCAAYTTSSNDLKTYGNYIEIDHGNGYKTRYAHLTTGMMQVSTGNYVQQGQLIGYSGTTGSSTGPHLHFEIITPNGRVNPTNTCSGYANGSTSTTPSGNDPQGVLDGAVSNSAGKLTVTGWAFDRDDLSASLGIHIYLGDSSGPKTCVGAITANKGRADVNAAYPGVGNYHGFDDTISVSQSGTYTVYVYAINVGGGTNNTFLGSKTVNIHKDSTAPSISNIVVSQITSKGYRVTCNVSDNIGVTSVKFPTWTPWNNGQDDLIWHEGTISGNIATVYINTSDHNNETGSYITHIYAYDSAGNSVSKSTEIINISDYLPTISNIKISQVTSKGYRVTCNVSANAKITSVKFPTWTDNNGQDDLIWHEGTISGNIATVYINTSNHNNETGSYITHIYAYDSVGNSVSKSTEIINIPKPVSVKIKSLKTAKVLGLSVSYKYTGKNLTPTVTVKDGTKTLKKGTDYTVTYSNNKAIGTAKVTIKGKGNYSGTITKTFKIVLKTATLKTVSSPKTKQLKATWAKDTTATGYQIQYSTNSKFTSGNKTKNITKNSTTSATITKLTKGKTYYVRIRSYKTVSGQKVYGAYSTAKKVKIK